MYLFYILPFFWPFTAPQAALSFFAVAVATVLVSEALRDNPPKALIRMHSRIFVVLFLFDVFLSFQAPVTLPLTRTVGLYALLYKI